MSEEASSSQIPTCQFIFKKRKPSQQTRKRQKSVSSEDANEGNEEATSAVVQPTYRKAKHNPNVHSTNSKRKRTDKEVDSSSSEEEEDGPSVSYKSNRSAMPSGSTDQNATAVLEIETEKDRDAQALFEKRLEVNKELEGKEDDKIYR